MNETTPSERRRLEQRIESIKQKVLKLRGAAPIDKDAIESAMDELDGATARLHLLINALREIYPLFLERAEKSDDKEDWAVVVGIEDYEIELRTPPTMRGPEGAERRADYLNRHPHCTSCEARGHRVASAIPVILARGGDGDENIAPMCRICAYVLTARANGWPVRGCDAGGYPNDPGHHWNK